MDLSLKHPGVLTHLSRFQQPFPRLEVEGFFFNGENRSYGLDLPEVLVKGDDVFVSVLSILKWGGGDVMGS